MEIPLHLYLVAAACVPLAVMAAGLVLLLFRHNLNATMLMQHVKKLIDAGNTERAIKLCLAADCPATTLCFYLLGLEESGSVLVRSEHEGGYRDAGAKEVPFADRVAALADRELRELQRSKLRRPGLAAVIGGLLGFLLGLAAWLIAFPPTGWQPSWIDAVPLVGLLGALWGLQVWRRISAGLRHVVATLLPLLRPVEEMDEEARAAAARARRAHELRRASRRAASAS
jgi:hypothetical protein